MMEYDDKRRGVPRSNNGAYQRKAMEKPLPVRAVSALDLSHEPEEAAEVIRSVVTLVWNAAF